MHVLILGAGWPPEIFIERKLRALVAAGARITLAEVVRPAGRHWRGIPGVTYIPLINPRNISPGSLGSAGRGLAEAVRLDREIPGKLWRTTGRHAASVGDNYALWRHGLAFVTAQPDIIHFEWNSSAIRYEWVFDYFTCPTVISCRGRQTNILPHIPGFEDYAEDLKRTLRKATFVHCVSDAMRACALDLGVDKDRAVVVRTSLDPELYGTLTAMRQRDHKVERLRLVTVGGLIWRKGYEYLIRAVHEVRRRGSNVQLDIIGSGSESDRIKQTIDELELGGEVRLLGQLSPEDVRKHVQLADVYVLSSLSEGLSNSVVEAMACSIPVITTSCGGMTEAVTDGLEGLVVAPRSVNDMADAICTLSADESLRRRMGRAGREKAMRDYMPQRQAEDFLDLYRRSQELNRLASDERIQSS